MKHGKSDARTRGKDPVKQVGKLGNEPETKMLKAIPLALHHSRLPSPDLQALPSPSPYTLPHPYSQSAKKESQ